MNSDTLLAYLSIVGQRKLVEYLNAGVLALANQTPNKLREGGGDTLVYIVVGAAALDYVVVLPF